MKGTQDHDPRNPEDQVDDLGADPRGEEGDLDQGEGRQRPEEVGVDAGDEGRTSLEAPCRSPNGAARRRGFDPGSS